MASGLSMYNEMVANVVHSFTGMPVNDVFAILLRRLEQPQGFANTCSIASHELQKFLKRKSSEKYCFYQEHERAKQINRLYIRFNHYCEKHGAEYSYDEFCKYIRAMDIVSRITDPQKEKRDGDCYLGNLDRVLLEAITQKKPIDLVKIQCLRLIQDTDENGRHRLGISTNIEAEEVITRGGKVRKYEDVRSLVEYMEYCSREFDHIGIHLRPTILITDDDVRNMYPQNEVIPAADVEGIERDAHGFVGKLQKYAERQGYTTQVVLISELTERTSYTATKNAIRTDCIKGGMEQLKLLVSESEFSTAVKADQKKYGLALGYSVEVSKFKVGNAFGVLRALYDLAQTIEKYTDGNVLFVAREKPYLQNHMAVPLSGDKSERTPTLLAYSEGRNVFYEEGIF